MEKKVENSVVGLVTIKESDKDKKSLCIKKMYIAKDKVKEVCTDLETKEKLLGVIEVG